MASFRVLVFSPRYEVIRRRVVDAANAEAAKSLVEFMLDEANCLDPEAHYDIKEKT
jgi:hypothetical protein